MINELLDNEYNIFDDSFWNMLTKLIKSVKEEKMFIKYVKKSEAGFTDMQEKDNTKYVDFLKEKYDIYALENSVSEQKYKVKRLRGKLLTEAIDLEDIRDDVTQNVYDTNFSIDNDNVAVLEKIAL